MKAPQRIVVLGAGGQARDVAWLIEEIDRAGSARLEVAGFVVSSLARLGPHDSRDRVLGDYAWLEDNRDRFEGLALGIGTPAARLRVAQEVSRVAPQAEWPTLVHPGAVFCRRTARLAPGATIACGVAGTVHASLERWALVNVSVTLGHECTIGEGSVVNHAASISGGVVLERGVLVGTGARVLQYLRVGEGSTIGAGAVVTRDVPPGATVVGVPARARSGA